MATRYFAAGIHAMCIALLLTLILCFLHCMPVKA